MLPREHLVAWVSFGGWSAVSAAAISLIGIMVVSTARFIVGRDFKLFLKRRILTGLNFVGPVVVFFTIIYVQVQQAVRADAGGSAPCFLLFPWPARHSSTLNPLENV